MNGLRILTDSILTTFAEVAYTNRNRIFRAWLITPWIASEDSPMDPVSLLVEAFRASRPRVDLVTRKPMLAWHQQALQVLYSNVSPILYYCSTLHAKLYLLECDDFRYALIGSPNLTGRADKGNKELAVEMRTTVRSQEDDVAVAVTRLTQYARSLVGEDGVLIQDRP